MAMACQHPDSDKVSYKNSCPYSMKPGTIGFKKPLCIDNLCI
jgi:hypothetical protein